MVGQMVGQLLKVLKTIKSLVAYKKLLRRL